MADYPINKGIGHSVEFKGLKAQYLFIFAGGLMKLLAAKSHPRYILNRRKTNRMFKYKKKEE